jgi:hypothetical protein
MTSERADRGRLVPRDPAPSPDPADAQGTPLTDDPTPGGDRDGMDPGEERRSPAVDRHHGGVKDPTHPDYFTVEHRYLPDPSDPLDQPERRLTVDDHASQTAGPGAATQAQLGGRTPSPGATRPDSPDDPRRDRPDAEPAST